MHLHAFSTKALAIVFCYKRSNPPWLGTRGSTLDTLQGDTYWTGQFVSPKIQRKVTLTVPPRLFNAFLHCLTSPEDVAAEYKESTATWLAMLRLELGSTSFQHHQYFRRNRIHGYFEKPSNKREKNRSL